MKEWISRIRGAGLFGRSAVRRLLALVEGQPLIMIREPANPMDPNAIKLCDLLGKEVGYVEASISADVAPYIDAHVVVLAAVYKTKPRRWSIRPVWALARIWIEDHPWEAIQSRLKRSRLKPSQEETSDGQKDRVRDRQRDNRRKPARRERVRASSRARSREW